jgi:hypothetical protein
MTMTMEPIGITPAWRAAVDAAGGQCEGRAKGGRCGHTLAGGWRLYLATDGRVYCENHRAPTPADAPVIEAPQQDSLF